MTNQQDNELSKIEEGTKPVVKKELTPTEIDNLKKFFSDPHTSEEQRLKEYDGLRKTRQRSKEQEDRKEKLSMELAIIHGFDNGILLQSIVGDKRCGPGLIKMRRGLIEEHRCKAASEFMLVDKIVTAYWKSMRYETFLNRIIEPELDKFIFKESQIKIIKEIQKGIELANRQFETSLTLLKSLKQPKLNVKVSADNAYIAQNQQVINTDEINPSPKEIIKAN
ncbi:MAG: hypothetical protein PHV78_01740 [Patescibacteria group bacterium]|nr:hypothetical protein [Patescibacteria group bacterium]MDD5121127.1 hypothetical protein [Patescibacteria group bacterium]MDD5221642.1 hypothetical protein [Patescibacteria group bacterium]MDD5395954.1 hypothetical protein [Patescibacteria group bacterium]